MGSLVMLYQLLCLMLFCLSSQSTFSSSSFSPSNTSLCSHIEASALFKFKSSFSINKTASEYCEYSSTPSYPKTNSWKEESDCCSWDGVTCDYVTGNVIGLDLSCSWLYGSFPSNTTLFHLPHLQKLNLAFNHFNYSKMSSEFAQFKSLVQLDLSLTYFSGQIPPQISHLSKLVSLDLSWNYHQTLDKHTLKRLVQNLTEVRQLLLDGINMSSINPIVLMNMSSSLSSLSLGICGLQGKFPENIFHLPNLKSLKLGPNHELNIYLPEFNQSNHLEQLDLQYTNLYGVLPNSIGNLVSLKLLDLSDMNLSVALFHSIGSLVCLEELHLESCNFSGIIPTSLGNLSQLNTLMLSGNHFSGQISSSLINLTQLEFLYIEDNHLEGSIPNEITIFPNLIELDLSSNFLNGPLPSWLYTNPSLTYVDLSNNQLSGHIKQFHYKSLEQIQLQNNNLQGLIPSSISQLVNLTQLDLSSNNLSGNVESNLFSNLQNLMYLDLSHNNFHFNSDHTSADYILPNLGYLYLSSCNVNRFPQFLRGSNVLESLDLSDNRIHGKIPKWMWDVGKDSLLHLILSHNAIIELKQLPWRNIQILDLHSNRIQGNLPIPPLGTHTFFISNNNLSGAISDRICDISSLELLDMSHNNLSGAISNRFCNISSLELLDMSHNNLSGGIPQCFGKLSKTLWMLNLGTNKLHGTIPSTFAKGCQLENLNLNDNQLEGPLTQSILNCTSLKVLDLGNNKINGAFPHWLGTLQELKVLVLRSNQMHSSISGKRHTHSFPKLQIFDISNNNFLGQLPTRYIKNLKAMMNVERKRDVNPYIGGSGKQRNGFYSYSAHVVVKGQTFELMKIFATLTIIDLSNNKFEGEIPGVIGKLSSIIGLNLSHNLLIGCIPPSFGNLTNLEWLDLSSNKLSGQIPEDLVNLTMLSSLNLSENELVGCIPKGKQFNTFDNHSYEGNDGLCGFPLSKDCNSNEAEQPSPSTLQEEDHSKSGIRFGWKVVLIGYVSGFAFGVGIGCVVLWTGKPKSLVRLIEVIWLMRLVGIKRYQRPKKNARASRRRS